MYHVYGLESEDYTDLMLSLRPGMLRDRDEVIEKLVDIQYTRNEIDFRRGTFRVKGMCWIFILLPPEAQFSSGVFGDEIDRITEVDPLTGEIIGQRHIAIFLLLLCYY